MDRESPLSCRRPSLPWGRAAAVSALWLLSVATSVAAITVGACSNSPPPSASPTDAGPDTVVLLQPDVGVPYVPAVPSPIFQACSSGTGCPDAYVCFTGHTSPTDVSGECTLECTGDNAALCTVSGGSCVCPLSGGHPGDCLTGNDAGAVTVCIPSPDAGEPSPGNDGNDAGIVTDASAGGAKDGGADGGMSADAAVG